MDGPEQIFPSYLVIFPPSFETIFCAPKNSEKKKMNRTPAFSHQTQQACHPPRLGVVATVVGG